MPVTIGALGTIKKGSDLNRQLLPGYRSAIELQKVKLMRNAYCSVSAGVNRCDLLLGSGLTGRPPPDN